MSPRNGARRIHASVGHLTIALSLLAFACGGARPGYADSSDDRDSGTSTTPPAEQDPIVIVDVHTIHQTIEGFGAAVAWYQQQYTRHPNREKLQTILFKDLGLDILRIRNQHRSPLDNPDPPAVEIYRDAEASLGRAPRVLLSSWSPPAELKANDATDCEDQDPNCTLKKDQNGRYVYDDFGEYWADSLEAYRAAGIDPYFISIQNEPDFTPDTGRWEACRFDATESSIYPGYDQAFAAVVNSLSARGLEARLLGPEMAQIGDARVERYLAKIDTTKLHGSAFHLYGGGSWQTPSSYDLALSGIASQYGNLPRFQTEFSPTDGGAAANDSGFEVASLIHGTLTAGGASAYLHWELFWPTSGLVSIEAPQNQAAWSSADGFTINPAYYSMRHYSKYTDPGYRRVEVTSNRATVLASGYVSEDERTLTLILLNTATKDRSFTLDLGDFSPKQGLARETTSEQSWKSVAASTDSKSQLSLPPRSITTLVLSENDSIAE